MADRAEATSLARGAAVITIATAASRVTGFLRVVAVAAAMGTTFLANTYQTANTAPNLIFELVAAGVLTSVFVPTFVNHLLSGGAREAWKVGNVLMSVAVTALVALAVVLAVAAPLVMRALTVGVEDPTLRADEVRLGTTLLRLFAPQVVFYGLGMIWTAALHAQRHFLLPAVAPIFNNVIVIGVYVAFALMRRGDAEIGEITTGQTLLLGIGTTAGVVAMTLCLLPRLRSSGWKLAWEWDPAHPAVRNGMRLAVWALSYAGGYQAGLIVVLLFANRVEGGVAAYQWAFTFFYLPHALVAVPIFNVLFPAMAEEVARGDDIAFERRLTEGLQMLLFLLAPAAAFLFVVGEPLARLTLEYGVMTGPGAAMVGRVLTAFALGLPGYSAFLVITRAHYARQDTRTPAIVNGLAIVIASVTGPLLFVFLPDDWRVPGLALAHSIAFTTCLVPLARPLLTDRAGRGRPLARVGASTAVAAAVMAAAGAPFGTHARGVLLLKVVTTAVAGAAAYLGTAYVLRLPELGRLAAATRALRRR